MNTENEKTSAEAFMDEMRRRREAADKERASIYQEPLSMPRAYANTHTKRGLTATLMRTGMFSSEEQLGLVLIGTSIVGMIISSFLMWPKSRPSAPIPPNLIPTPYAQQTKTALP